MSPTVLHLVAGAAERDRIMALEVAKARLREGDDPNAREEEGLTPLHVAAHWDNLAMVQLLLLHGSDVWAEDGEGRTPMAMATGATKRFLERMHNRTEGERRSILSRMGQLHLGTRIGKVWKGARKKMRKTLGSILPGQRRRAESELNNPGVIITSTPRPSIADAAAAAAAANAAARPAALAAGEARGSCRSSCSTASSSRPPAADATATTEYYTADEGEQTRRGSLAAAAAAAASRTTGSGLLVLQWKRAATPPRVERPEIGDLPEDEIGWIRGLEKKRERKEEERRERKEGKVTLRKGQTPAKKKEKKRKEDGEYRPPPLTSASDSEEDTLEAKKSGGGGEAGPSSSPSPTPSDDPLSPDATPRKKRAPRGLRKRVEEMSEERLRSELKAVGVLAGPIAARGGVRKGYEKKLIEALIEGGEEERMRRIVRGVPPNTPLSTAKSQSSSKTPTSAAVAASKTPDPKAAAAAAAAAVQGVKYSRPLELAIAGRAWQEAEAQQRDEQLRSIFINKGVSAFCYLLIDPRMLPAQNEEMKMGQLVDAIFYVGKGTKQRPHQHLIDAKAVRDGTVTMRKTVKLARILDIWHGGRGVVSMQLSLNICDEEALTREASLIDAIGLQNLTNEKGGTYYGTAAAWSAVQKAQLGTLMLRRVFRMVCADPSMLTQIRPEALPDQLFRPYGGKKQPAAATAAAAAAARPAHPMVIPGTQNRIRAVV